MNNYNGRDGNGYQPLPDPPPMRVGTQGDTVGKDGIRRKADGTLRTWHPDILFGWFTMLVFVGGLFSIVALMSK